MAIKQIKKSLRLPEVKAKEILQNQSNTKSINKQKLKFILFLGIVSIAVYTNSLKNDYALDDSSAITKNTIVQKGISGIPELLVTPYHYGYEKWTNDLYRPLSLVIFALDYQLFGLNPMPGHFINILLYVCCVILLFLFLHNLFERKNTTVAFIAAILFSLHPVHTEVVDNIKSCDELLCFFFAFISVNTWIKYSEGGKAKHLLLGSVCYLLSLLSKETAITFLAIIPPVFFIYKIENKRRSFFVVLSSVITAMIYILIRYSVLEFHHANHFSDISFIDNVLSSDDISYSNRIATAISMLGYYLKLLLIPYPLISDYSYNSIKIVDFINPKVIFSAVIYLIILIYCLAILIKRKKNMYGFGMLFFLCTISIFSNIPFLIGATIADRFLFFPSVGFCLVAALLADKSSEILLKNKSSYSKKMKLIIIVVPILFVFSYITYNRNAEWKNDYTIFTADITKQPQDCKLNYCLGYNMMTAGGSEDYFFSTEESIKNEGKGYIYKSLDICPDYIRSHVALCDFYFLGHQFDSAEVHGKKAINSSMNNSSLKALAMNELGEIYFFKKKYVEAIKMSKTALNFRPATTESYINIAISFLSLGKADSSIKYLFGAIAVDPAYNKSYEFLALTYRSIGKLDSARYYEIIAQKNNPAFSL